MEIELSWIPAYAGMTGYNADLLVIPMHTRIQQAGLKECPYGNRAFMDFSLGGNDEAMPGTVLTTMSRSQRTKREPPA